MQPICKTIKDRNSKPRIVGRGFMINFSFQNVSDPWNSYRYTRREQKNSEGEGRRNIGVHSHNAQPNITRPFAEVKRFQKNNFAERTLDRAVSHISMFSA